MGKKEKEGIEQKAKSQISNNVVMNNKDQRQQSMGNYSIGPFQNYDSEDSEDDDLRSISYKSPRRTKKRRKRGGLGNEQRFVRTNGDDDIAENKRKKHSHSLKKKHSKRKSKKYRSKKRRKKRSTKSMVNEVDDEEVSEILRSLHRLQSKASSI